MSPILLVGGLLLGLLLVAGAGIALFTGGRTDVDERMDRYVGGSAAAAALPVEQPRQPRRPAVGERLDTAIGERGFTRGIRARIAKADVKLRVSEYIGLRILLAVLAGALVYLLLGQVLLFAIAALIAGSFIPPIYLAVAARRRLRAFEDQLSQTLNLWVNALRSGYSVLQSMEAIATELPPPVSTEFERVVQEVRLGLSVPQALANMLRRMPSEDLDLVVTAVNIQREVGGNLAEVLDTISFTIRERVRIKGEIRTLTAQGRLSGWIVSLLPIFLAFVLLGINADYMSQLWVDLPPRVGPIPCGWIVIAIGLIMMGIGIYIIQRIVDIEV
ncbi:MAG: type II secretion system F family protein [Chloroflexota bacterium]